VREEGDAGVSVVTDGLISRARAGLFVLTLTGDHISALTRFDNTVPPRFGLPRSLPSQ
jgi:RNA polymerase sigma-70 factor (ECF subfamily)